jgi:hypothetical protein
MSYILRAFRDLPSMPGRNHPPFVVRALAVGARTPSTARRSGVRRPHFALVDGALTTAMEFAAL